MGFCSAKPNLSKAARISFIASKLRSERETISFMMSCERIICLSAANFASAILIESGLSFLGIGTQPPVPSWGGMVKDHFRYLLLGKPYLTLLPGLAIMSLVLAFMTLGNSLRDFLDVKN